MVYFPLVALAGFVHESVDGFGCSVQEGYQTVSLRRVAGFREGHGVVGFFAETSRLALNGLNFGHP